MSAETTGSPSVGEDNVNAVDGVDEAATIMAAPAMAARTPRGTREESMLSSILTAASL